MFQFFKFIKFAPCLAIGCYNLAGVSVLPNATPDATSGAEEGFCPPSQPADPASPSAEERPPDWVCQIYPQFEFPCQGEDLDEVALWLRYYYKHQSAPRWAARGVLSYLAQSVSQTGRPAAASSRSGVDDEYQGLTAMKALFFATGALWALLEGQGGDAERIAEVVGAYRAGEERRWGAADDESGPLVSALWLCGSPACAAHLRVEEMLRNPGYGTIGDVSISFDDIQLKLELLCGYFVISGDTRAVQRLLEFLWATHASAVRQGEGEEGEGEGGEGESVDLQTTRMVLWQAHQQALKMLSVYCLQHEQIRRFLKGELPQKPNFAGFPPELVQDIQSLVSDIEKRIEGLVFWKEPKPNYHSRMIENENC